MPPVNSSELIDLEGGGSVYDRFNEIFKRENLSWLIVDDHLNDGDGRYGKSLAYVPPKPIMGTSGFHTGALAGMASGFYGYIHDWGSIVIPGGAYPTSFDQRENAEQVRRFLFSAGDRSTYSLFLPSDMRHVWDEKIGGLFDMNSSQNP